MAKLSAFNLCSITFCLLFYFSEASELSCSKPFEIDGKNFDLKSLNKVTTVKNNITTKPSITEFLYQINPCSPITIDEAKDKEDQCESGTFLCEIITNYRKTARVTQVISFGKNPFDVSAEYEVGTLKLKLKSQGEKINNEQKSCNIDLFCSDVDKEPEFANLSDGILNFKWYTKAACPTSEKQPAPKEPDSKKPDANPPSSNGGSIFGFLILASIMFYLIGGMAYNHYVYNLRGIYLIPHLSFWREFPDQFMSFLHHLISLVSGRRRNSYSRV